MSPVTYADWVVTLHTATQRSFEWLEGRLAGHKKTRLNETRLYFPQEVIVMFLLSQLNDNGQEYSPLSSFSSRLILSDNTLTHLLFSLAEQITGPHLSTAKHYNPISPSLTITDNFPVDFSQPKVILDWKRPVSTFNFRQFQGHPITD